MVSRSKYKERRERGVCTTCEGEVALDIHGRKLSKCHKHLDEQQERSGRRAADLFAKGLCVLCGKRPFVSGCRHCVVCKERGVERSKEWYASKKAAGLCVQCGFREATHGVFCEEDSKLAQQSIEFYDNTKRKHPRKNNHKPYTPLNHEQLVARRRHEKAVKADRIRRGVCVVCENPELGISKAGKRLRRCRPCADKANKKATEKYNARLARGLCTECGKVPHLPDLVFCENCRAKIRKNANKRYATRVAAGLCTMCSNPAEDGTTFCAVHREERRADASTRYYAKKDQDHSLLADG